MKTKLVLLFLLLFVAQLPNAEAQRKSKKQSNDKESVVIVDDESCGCELYFIDGIQTTERDGYFGFKREDGTVIVDPKYKFVDQFHGDYCIVYYDYYKCGIIDREGKTIVPVEYEEVNYPTDGMMRVRKNNLYGFIDTAGNVVIDCQYRTASGFNEGLAVVLIDFDSNTCAYGYIDKSNKLVIPAQYEYANPFSEGYAVVKKYDRYGFIDHQGREMLPYKYIELTPMIDGRFFAVDALTEQAAMFDNRFHQLTPFVYESVNTYEGGFYTVQRNGKITFLDLKGKERFGFYDEVSGFFDGFSMVKRDGKYGIISDRGKTILPIEYDNSGYRSMEYIFSDGLAMIEKGGRYGFCNRRGNIVIPLEYESAQHYTEGLIPVCLHNRWGFIDKDNNVVCPFEFEAASYFEWGRAEVVYKGEAFKINPDGQCVKNCKKYPKQIKFKKH